MEIHGGQLLKAPEHKHHPTHWLTALMLALVALLISGLGWSWISSSGLTHPLSRPGLSAPSLPDFKLPSAPRPTG